MMKGMLPHIAALAVLLLPTVAFGQENLVTLTQIPGLTEGMSGTPNLPNFLNGLYKFCIGIAVVLAVIQLIRAGIEYMTAGGSIGSTEHAKHLISTSILGLVLVLSPYIVFGIINPEIRNLRIDVGELKTNLPSNRSGGPEGINTASTTSETKDGCTTTTYGAGVTQTTCVGAKEGTANVKSALAGKCPAPSFTSPVAVECKEYAARKIDRETNKPEQGAQACIKYETSGYCSPKKTVWLLYTGSMVTPGATDGVSHGSYDSYSAVALFGDTEKWGTACGQSLRTTDGGIIYGVDQPRNMIRGGYECAKDEKFVTWVDSKLDGKTAHWCAKIEAYCALK